MNLISVGKKSAGLSNAMRSCLEHVFNKQKKDFDLLVYEYDPRDDPSQVCILDHFLNVNLF
jgi:hypothetical protein